MQTVLIGVVIAAAGLFLSILMLARMAGAPAPVLPLPRLKGYDFIVGGVIFIGMQLGFIVLIQLPAGAENKIPLWLNLVSALIAGGSTWAWLGWRAGSFLPRRRAVPERKVDCLGTAFRCYLLSLPGLLGISYFNYHLVALVAGEGPSQAVAVGFDELGLLDMGLAFIFIGITQPCMEEVLFRGYLWRHFAGRSDFGPRRALLFSSLVFALAHEWQVFLPVFYLGLTFGWIYWRSGKLRHAIAIHALHNSCAVGLIAFL